MLQTTNRVGRAKLNRFLPLALNSPNIYREISRELSKLALFMPGNKCYTNSNTSPKNTTRSSVRTPMYKPLVDPPFQACDSVVDSSLERQNRIPLLSLGTRFAKTEKSRLCIVHHGGLTGSVLPWFATRTRFRRRITLDPMLILALYMERNSFLCYRTTRLPQTRTCWHPSRRPI